MTFDEWFKKKHPHAVVGEHFYYILRETWEAAEGNLKERVRQAFFMGQSNEAAAWGNDK